MHANKTNATPITNYMLKPLLEAYFIVLNLKLRRKMKFIRFEIEERYLYQLKNP